MDYEDLKPAPEPLNLVQRFVNTRNYLYGGDRLENVEEASAWLVECGLLDAREQLGELGRQCLVNFREGLRGLLLAHNHRSEVNVRALNNLIASTTL